MSSRRKQSWSPLPLGLYSVKSMTSIAPISRFSALIPWDPCGMGLRILVSCPFSVVYLCAAQPYWAQVSISHALELFEQIKKFCGDMQYIHRVALALLAGRISEFCWYFHCLLSIHLLVAALRQLTTNIVYGKVRIELVAWLQNLAPVLQIVLLITSFLMRHVSKVESDASFITWSRLIA